MRKLNVIIVIFALICFISGCEDSDNALVSTPTLDAINLLGLENGRTLIYIQTETEITFDPFLITRSDTVLTVKITGLDQDWVVHRNDEPLINLKISENSIIQNGYWREINGLDSLVYYSNPPLIYERNLLINTSWEYYTPFYTTNSGSILLPYYFSNFGFKVNKTYSGTEDIITPAGEFSSHRYDLLLFTTEFGDTPVAEITEYYAPSVGLIKQELVNGNNTRSLILVDFTD